MTQSILITVIIEFFIYLIAWIILKDNLVVSSLKPWLANSLYAIDVIIVTYLVFYGFKHLEAQIGSLIVLSELIFVLVLGFVFYQEVPTVMQLIGGGFILAGMIVPQFIKR